MSRKMKNVGLHPYRFAYNPAERKFAKAWEQRNVSPTDGRLDGKGTLDYLLAEDCNHPCGEVTERDRQVAATVSQWLGSPVGQFFLGELGHSDVLARILSQRSLRPLLVGICPELDDMIDQKEKVYG